MKFFILLEFFNVLCFYHSTEGNTGQVKIRGGPIYKPPIFWEIVESGFTGLDLNF